MSDKLVRPEFMNKIAINDNKTKITTISFVTGLYLGLFIAWIMWGQS